MFMPERIDHHGWQLALLALGMSGIADPKRVRGALTLGISTALSLAIGLEMLIYIAIMGAAMALFWVVAADERDRLRTYAVSLGGATALSFLVFASYANRAAVCDALSPVWLSDVLLGGALLYGLSLLAVGDWRKRLALALVAGVVLAVFHALTWPNCLQRLEGVSPEVYSLWLSHVKEARPIYMHGWRVASMIIALPITGLVGWAILACVHGATRSGCGASSARPCRGSPRPCCSCGRRALDRPRRCLRRSGRRLSSGIWFRSHGARSRRLSSCSAPS